MQLAQIASIIFGILLSSSVASSGTEPEHPKALLLECIDHELRARGLTWGGLRGLSAEAFQNPHQDSEQLGRILEQARASYDGNDVAQVSDLHHDSTAVSVARLAFAGYLASELYVRGDRLQDAADLWRFGRETMNTEITGDLGPLEMSADQVALTAIAPAMRHYLAEPAEPADLDALAEIFESMAVLQFADLVGLLEDRSHEELVEYSDDVGESRRQAMREALTRYWEGIRKAEMLPLAEQRRAAARLDSEVDEMPYGVTAAPVHPYLLVMEEWCSSLRNGMILALHCARFKAQEGRYPESLAQLVPRYLDAIPSDPLAPEGGFQYAVSDEADQVVLFSLGFDGKKDPAPRGDACGMSLAMAQTTGADIVFLSVGDPAVGEAHGQ